MERVLRLSTAVSLAVLLSFWVCDGVTAAETKAQEDTCATCHLALGIENLTRPAELYKADVHAAKGFGCAACHGGDPNIMGLEAMDRKRATSASPHTPRLSKCVAGAIQMRILCGNIIRRCASTKLLNTIPRFMAGD